MPASSPAAAAAAINHKPLQQLQPQQQQQQLQQPQPGPHDAADAAMYREMRQALCSYDEEAAAGSARGPAPRHKAFYAALRSVLGQVLEEKTEASRHTRLLAAHQWYVKHKPRPRPADMSMAAAMAASLSVQGPTEAAAVAAEQRQTPASSGTAGGAAGSGSASNTDSRRKQQQQQPFCVLGMRQQLPCTAGHSACQAPDGAAAAGARQVCSSRSSRWQERQPRLHELDCPGPGQLRAAAAPGSSSCCSQCGAALAACCCSAHQIRSAAAAPAGGGGRAVVAEVLPEQPSMRQVPAICATTRQQVGSVSAAGRLGGGTAAAAANAAAAGLPPPDGLIPLGSLPSGRFGLGLGSSTSSSKGGSGGSADDASYAGAREQWRLVAAQQQQVEGAVAAHMRSYARHRARLEEEINRKQEVGAQLAAAQQQQQQHLQDFPASCGSAGLGRQQLQGGQGAGARVLLHVDSQHQPSQVATAYTGLAGGASSAQRLAPVDKVKEAKQQLLQESQRECAEVAEHVSRLGISVDVQRALLPLPDQPYISCIARLPRPGAADSGAAKVEPGKNKKLKTKGAAKKGAKAQAAVKKKQK